MHDPPRECQLWRKIGSVPRQYSSSAALPSIGMGMVSPFAIRLADADRCLGRRWNPSGTLYALLTTLGSILGTMLTTFVLIPSFGAGAILKGSRPAPSRLSLSPRFRSVAGGIGDPAEVVRRRRQQQRIFGARRSCACASPSGSEVERGEQHPPSWPWPARWRERPWSRPVWRRTCSTAWSRSSQGGPRARRVVQRGPRSGLRCGHVDWRLGMRPGGIPGWGIWPPSSPCSWRMSARPHAMPERRKITRGRWPSRIACSP